jgi:hypothetical protein
MQGAQKLRSEEHLRVRRNDEVEAQGSRWAFYETIKISWLLRSAFLPGHGTRLIQGTAYIIITY